MTTQNVSQKVFKVIAGELVLSLEFKKIVAVNRSMHHYLCQQ